MDAVQTKKIVIARARATQLVRVDDYVSTVNTHCNDRRGVVYIHTKDIENSVVQGIVQGEIGLAEKLYDPQKDGVVFSLTHVDFGNVPNNERNHTFVEIVELRRTLKPEYGSRDKSKPTGLFARVRGMNPVYGDRTDSWLALHDSRDDLLEKMFSLGNSEIFKLTALHYVSFNKPE